METILDILDRRAGEEANRPALTYLSDGETVTEQLTYGQLRSRAMHVAKMLSECCVPSDRALLLYPQGLEFVIAFLGCLYAGVVAVPAYPPRSRKPDARIPTLVHDARPAILLTVSSVRDRMDHYEVPVIVTDGLCPDRCEVNLSRRSTLAWLQYTSGSTTSPRGVMISHDNLVHNAACLLQAAQYSSDTIAVTWLPHFHDMGLVEALLQPIFHGFPLYLFPAPIFLQRPLKWLSLISRYSATHSGAPNFAYELCTKVARERDIQSLNLSSWSLAYVGAEPVYRDTLEAFYRKFKPCGFQWGALYPAYGMAETTLEISGGVKGQGPRFVNVNKSALSKNRVEAAREMDSDTATLVSCGYPLQEFDVRIVDPTNHTLCVSHEVGEIWLAGTSVAQGYWGRDEETQTVFRSYTSTGDGPYLRTGDLGCLINGELFITGRLKDLIIVRGRNYYPSDIEHVVLEHLPEVDLCAVFESDARDGGHLVVLVEADRHLCRELRLGGSSTDLQTMVRKVQQAIGESVDLSCDHVMVVPPGFIPTTSSGKIQRHLCRERYQTEHLKPLWQWRRSAVAPDGLLEVST